MATHPRISLHLALLLWALSLPTLPATLTYRVVGVTDGDTITVLDSPNGQHKVRLAAIDAPEKAHTDALPPASSSSHRSLSVLLSTPSQNVARDRAQ
jgi:endonuclease YncB( thermonuclease family)